MTDVFNIDQIPEGFRRNTLDWRKLHERYTKIAITKQERGIKPLPLTLLLKLFGPRKVLDTYIVSRRDTSHEQFDYPAQADVHTGADMRDIQVAKPLVFPGNNVLNKTYSDENGESPKKALPKVGMPLRPVFQRGLHVPGRYFPKPTTADEQREGIQSRSGIIDPSPNDRPRTLTPRSVYTPRSQGSGRLAKNSAKTLTSSAGPGLRSGFLRGPTCKATEISTRGVVLSGRTLATPRTPSTSALSNAENAKQVSDLGDRSGDKSDMFAISFRPDDKESYNGSNYDPRSELHSDYYTVKRLRLSARQVSFPGRGSGDFSTILQGRPKTLHHRRDVAESLGNHTLPKETRSKTHVGFVENDVVSS